MKHKKKNKIKYFNIENYYGILDWIIQRITSVIIGIYITIIFFLFINTNIFSSYENWSNIFNSIIMRYVTFISLLSIFYHSWIGMRNITIDYIHKNNIKILIQILIILWLLICICFSVKIIFIK